MTTRHSGVAKLWLLNLFGNAVLLSAVYLWLVLPDAHGWQVAASGLLALLVIFFGLWLRTGSFAYFRLSEFRERGAVWQAFRHGLRYIFAVLVWIIPLAAVEWGLFRLRQYAPQFGVWFWQKVPALRFGSPRQIYHAADWLLLVLMALAAALWLPVGITVAATGWKWVKMRHSLRVLKRIKYWGWAVAFAVIGGFVPYRIVSWIPDLNSLSKQAWSAGLRFLAAYLLLITSWIALLLVSGECAEQEDMQP